MSFHALHFCLLNVLFVIVKICIFHVTRIKVKTWIYGNINIDLFIINLLTLVSSWVPKVALVDTIQDEDEDFRHQKTKITSQKKVRVFHVLFHDLFLFHVNIFHSQTLILQTILYSILLIPVSGVTKAQFNYKFVFFVIVQYFLFYALWTVKKSSTIQQAACLN